MAFARTLASRCLSDRLARRLHPALPKLLSSSSTGDARKPSPLPPPPGPPAPRPSPFALAPRRVAQTLNLLAFDLHLLAGPPRRSFSSSSSSHDFDVADVLTDATHAAASFPSEVALAVEDSSIASAAVQHLIDAIHSFTGLNWWISIVLSTAVLRCVLITLCIPRRKRVYVMRQELLQIVKLFSKAKDDASIEEAELAGFSLFRKLGLPVFLLPMVTPYTFVTLYIAISNMAEKVPSLKGGGAFWYTDLTTPDALCIFPMITSLLIVLTFEAVSCFFVTWSSLNLAEMIALKQPAVQKVLFGEPLKPACYSCRGQKGPTAEGSPSSVEDHEQAVPPVRPGHLLILASTGPRASLIRNRTNVVKCDTILTTYRDSNLLVYCCLTPPVRPGHLLILASTGPRASLIRNRTNVVKCDTILTTYRDSNLLVYCCLTLYMIPVSSRQSSFWCFWQSQKHFSHVRRCFSASYVNRRSAFD